MDWVAGSGTPTRPTRLTTRQDSYEARVLKAVNPSPTLFWPASMQVLFSLLQRTGKPLANRTFLVAVVNGCRHPENERVLRSR